MEEQGQTKYEGWALVEIMGHRRAAGLVSTKYIGTAAFLQIVTPEVPPTEHTTTQDAWVGGHRLYAGSVVELSRPRSEVWVGSGSVYAITPISEADVLKHAPLETTVKHRAVRAAIAAALPEVSVEEESDEPAEDDDDVI